MGGDLADHVPREQVSRFISDQRHPRPLSLGQVHLVLHLTVEHLEDEVHAHLGVVLTDPRHVAVDQQDRPALDQVAHRHVLRVLEEALERRHPHDPVDLVARRIEPRRGLVAGDLQLAGELLGVEERGLLEPEPGARLRGDLPQRLAGTLGQQQAVDMLEHAVAQLRVLMGDRQRSDHRVVEVAPARLEDLPGRDRQQRGHD